MFPKNSETYSQETVHLELSSLQGLIQRELGDVSKVELIETRKYSLDKHAFYSNREAIPPEEHARKNPHWKSHLNPLRPSPDQPDTSVLRRTTHRRNVIANCNKPSVAGPVLRPNIRPGPRSTSHRRMPTSRGPPQPHLRPLLPHRGRRPQLLEQEGGRGHRCHQLGKQRE